jgi:hypothetical protein
MGGLAEGLALGPLAGWQFAPAGVSAWGYKLKGCARVAKGEWVKEVVRCGAKRGMGDWVSRMPEVLPGSGKVGSAEPLQHLLEKNNCYQAYY